MRDGSGARSFYGVIFAAGLDQSHVNTLKGNQIHDIKCDSVTIAGYGRVEANTIFDTGWDCENGPIPGGSRAAFDHDCAARRGVRRVRSSRFRRERHRARHQRGDPGPGSVASTTSGWCWSELRPESLPQPAAIELGPWRELAGALAVVAGRIVE